MFTLCFSVFVASFLKNLYRIFLAWGSYTPPAELVEISPIHFSNNREIFLKYLIPIIFLFFLVNEN